MKDGKEYAWEYSSVLLESDSRKAVIGGHQMPIKDYWKKVDRKKRETGQEAKEGLVGGRLT